MKDIYDVPVDSPPFFREPSSCYNCAHILITRTYCRLHELRIGGTEAAHEWVCDDYHEEDELYRYGEEDV